MIDLSKLETNDKIRINEVGPDGGAYELFYPSTHRVLRCIASFGLGWEHVSVSLPERCPRWDELEFAKRFFFLPHETAMQLHVPPKEHINTHPYTLHMWRPTEMFIPMPPKWMVG